jgi:hypothetical protein
MLLAFSLIPAIHISAAAQGVSGAGDGAGDAFVQVRSVEPAKARAPEDLPAKSEHASEPPKPSAPAVVPTPLGIAFDNKLYAESYRDAYRILKEENTCSRFFGGAASATEVLNRLTEQLRKKRFDNPHVAVEMSGAVVIVRDNITGASYRLFERVSVNSIGPLHVPPVAAQTRRHLIGRFTSDTREARALILLHEIGHLVPGVDGRWLLPNDGRNAELSLRNSGTVESHCLKQLTALKH